MGGSSIKRLSGIGVQRALISDPDSCCQHGKAQGPDHTTGDLCIGTLILRDGGVIGLEPAPTPVTRIVLPGLTEPHIHLDKCHTIQRLDFAGGDLEAAAQAQYKDKQRWTAQDLRARATRGLSELRAAGVHSARSHVDWGDASGSPAAPLAWNVLTEMAQGSDLTLQPAALTGITEMADLNYATNVARDVARSGGVLGSFIKTHGNRRAGLKNMFRLADQYGLALDFHVDEGLDPDLDGLELIADIALETKAQMPILCGHACALASKSPNKVARIADKLSAAGIAITVLPTTNLYLQGRRRGWTPDRRGLTRIHELERAGVSVIVGSDNVRDAFCPIGRHDPLYSLSVAVLAGHLDPPFGPHLSKITIAAQHALGLHPRFVDGALASDLLVFDATSLADLVADCGPAAPLSLQMDLPHAQ